MLTPAKIKNHHFEASGRNAYKADSVDSFFEEVAESYEQMFRENGEMYKKISLLAERLEEYRNDEDNIRNALLTAQRMAEKIQRDATEKAEALLTAAQVRADEENARIDAASQEMMAKATYQARAIVEEAQKQAEKLVYDATYESKAAAVSARDAMIKEEAALEMMKAEVTKFKAQILEMYGSQLALIQQRPEIICAAEEEEDDEIEVEIIEIPEEPAEEIAEEIAEEDIIRAEEEIVEEVLEIIEDSDEDMDVETLQQMIEETEDTDAEDEIVEDIDEDEEEYIESTGDFVIPSIDEESDEELDEIVENYIEETKPEADVYFANATRKPGEGFRVALDKLSVYDEDESEEDEDFDDEIDDEEFDDDDNNDGGLASKFKGFFRK